MHATEAYFAFIFDEDPNENYQSYDEKPIVVSHGLILAVLSNTYQAPPSMEIIKDAVRRPAPARSAVVIAAYVTVFEASVPVPKLVPFATVPPVLSLTGDTASLIRWTPIICMAFISCPTPVDPSYAPVVHFIPHTPPVHDAAAAVAEASR